MGRPEKPSMSFETYTKIWNNVLSWLGVTPVVQQQNEKGELVFRVSFWRLLNSFSVIVLSIGIVYVQIIDKNFVFSDLGNTLISVYLNLTGNIVTCLNIMSAVWNAKAYAALISSFLKFNRNSLCAKVNFIVKASAKFISFYVILLCFAFLIDFNILEEDKDMIEQAFLLNYISSLYNFLCVCQFAVCCFWLREYLLNINSKVEKHSRNLTSYSSEFFNTRSEFLKLNSVSPEEYYEPQPTEVEVNTMKYIRRLYHQVYLLSHRVNVVFSSRNLLTVCHNFFLGTILIYCGLTEVAKYSSKKSSLTIMETLNFFKFSLMSFVSIYGLIWPSTKVYSEVQRMKILVEEYFTRVPKGELEVELHSFILQLYHEKINFSPHGFFDLNNELLLSIIGSAASYLVILVQFRINLI